MPKLSKADEKAKTSANESRRSKEEALARLRWLEVLKAEGSVYDAAAVKTELADMHKQVRNSFLGIPGKMARQLAALTEPREVHEALLAEVTSILGNLSDELRLNR